MLTVIVQAVNASSKKYLTKKYTLSYGHCSHFSGGGPPAQIGFDTLLTLFDPGGRSGGADLPTKILLGLFSE